MRLVTYLNDDAFHPGLLLDDVRVVDIQTAHAIMVENGSVAADSSAPSSLVDLIHNPEQGLVLCQKILDAAASGVLNAATRNLSAVQLVAPIPRPLKNVFCVGSNYRAHVSEASRAQKKTDEAPKLPVFFTKPPTAVVGPGGEVFLDPSVSEKMDYEVELGIVIGTAGRNITQADAVSHIFGFTIINDVSARDLQRAHGGQFLKGKGLDTTCPMGPCILTIDELPDFENLRISLTVNGETRQDGNTKDMIFPIPELLESLSQGLTLEPGDVLATGTPSGVGYAMDPPHFLQHGDVVTCEIEGVGTLSNVIRNLEISPVG